MHITSNAIIFYGIILDDDYIAPWDETNSDSNWTEIIAQRMGLSPPNVKFKGNEERFKKYWTDKNKIINDLGISIEIFGNPKAIKYALAVKDSIKIASREFAELININEDFKIDKKDANTKLENFCKLLYIEKKITPEWYLTTYAEIKE